MPDGLEIVSVTLQFYSILFRGQSLPILAHLLAKVATKRATASQKLLVLPLFQQLPQHVVVRVRVPFVLAEGLAIGDADLGSPAG